MGADVIAGLLHVNCGKQLKVCHALSTEKDISCKVGILHINIIET